MCTAVTYTTKDHYFGRNLDLEYSYHEAVTVTPRNYPFRFTRMGTMETHYAMIGVAFVVADTPLYYDATNEKGLSMAGLNFPGYAVYQPEKEGVDNVASFEFIPWVLSQCATVPEVKALLSNMNLTDRKFSEQMPASTLHWMISDRDRSITVEPLADGLHIHDNPVEVLTNNPPFDYHMLNLTHYMGLSDASPEAMFCGKVPLKTFSKAMGSVGLPGDPSPTSRFVKAAFIRLNSRSGDSEPESVSQFFHILGSVAQQRGCAQYPDGKLPITVYSSCCNTDKGIYYYTTYENSQITGVDMYREDLDGGTLAVYPLISTQQIHMQN